jgi:hypothetical protein
VDLQEVIAHEYGLWAAAVYFDEWLAKFEAGAPAAAKGEAHALRSSIEAILTDGAPNPLHSQALREIVDHAAYQAQLHDAPCCNIRTFRQWLGQKKDLATQIHYVLAAVDYVLNTYVWALTIEMQELASLRKGLLINWSLLRELRSNGESADAEDKATIASLEESVRSMLRRCRVLLTTYGEI